MTKMVKIHKSQGFTLVELMIVIVIIAVMVAMSVNLASLVNKNRLTAQINTLIGSINLARSEAIKRAAPITMCRSNDDSDDCAIGERWDYGWLVFSDSDGDGSFEMADGDEILRAFAPLSGGDETVRNTLITTNGASNMIYMANGRLSNNIGRTFTLTDDDVPHPKTLVVGPSGRPRMGDNDKQ